MMMKSLACMFLLFSLGTAQFVFFGGRFQGGSSQPPRSQPFTVHQPATIRFGAQAQRFGVRPEPAKVPEPVVKTADEPVEEEPVVVVTDLNPERFYGPLFRSARKFHNDKNPKASAKHAEDVMIDVDVVKAAQVVGLRSEAPVQAVVLPAAVAVTPAPTTTAAPTTTTAAPTTTTTAAPTTTTPAPTTTTTAAPTTTTTAAPTTTTTAAPTTTTAAPTTTTAAAVTPLRIKSFVVGANGRPVFRPTSAPVVNTVNNAPVPDSRQPKALESSPRPKGNYQFNGKSYLLTWRNHRNNFDWNGGVQYCRSKGMKLISLDTKEKSEHFLRLVATDRAPYFWAGGRLSRDGRSLSWQNGKTESVSRGQHPWSFTGRTGPQPDGGEVCLAVLNNVYRDGVKYHDVSCHHRKPVVCEE